MATTYIAFCQSKTTGEEFVIPQTAPAGAHADTIRAEIHKTYSAAEYNVLTVYSLQELEDALEGVKRWPGVASRPQAAVAQRARTARIPTTTAIPQAAAPQQANSIFGAGSIINKKVPSAQTEAPAAPKPAARSATSTKTNVKQESLISVLKTMRQQQRA